MSYIDNFKTRYFEFRDEVFTIDKRRIKEFCRRVLEEGLNIRWTCQTRADLVDEKLLRLMKEAGCERLSFGIETGNPEIMKKIRKKIDLAQARKVIRMAKDQGLKVYCGFMIGLPWDTPRTIKDTVNWVSDVDPEYVGFQIFTPYPGNEMCYDAVSMGEILTDDLERYTTDTTVYLPRGLKEHGIVGYDQAQE